LFPGLLTDNLQRLENTKFRLQKIIENIQNGIPNFSQNSAIADEIQLPKIPAQSKGGQ
jgi:hypothetical protein